MEQVRAKLAAKVPAEGCAGAGPAVSTQSRSVYCRIALVGAEELHGMGGLRPIAAAKTRKKTSKDEGIESPEHLSLAIGQWPYWMD